MAAGSCRPVRPRDVFEKAAMPSSPASIGGHNVVERDGRSVAVRADKCRIVEGAIGPSIPSTRISVEYQGP